MIKIRFLIIGGSGFIGTNLKEELVLRGQEVEIFDIRDKDNPRDVNIDKELLFNSVKNCDVVFHLAAIPAHRLSVENPYKIISNNYNATLNILTACKAFEKKIIYASSFSVYGKQKPTWNEDTSLSCDTPYSHTKIASEQLLELYHKLYNTEVIIARLSNVFGPYEELHQPLQVLPIWFECKKRGMPLIVNGKNTTRDFTYVFDIVNGLILLSRQKGFNIFNICNGKETKISDVAKEISDDVEIKDLPNYEAERWVGSNKKMRKLGWQPTKDIFEWVREQNMMGGK